MKNIIYKVSCLFILLLLGVDSFAQSGGLFDGPQWLTYTIVIGAAAIAIFFVVQVAENFLAIEANQVGIDKDKNNVSIFPTWKEIAGGKKPAYVGGAEVTKLRKGHDILLEGEAKGAIEDIKIKSFAVQPTNFIGMSPIPKVTMEVGDKVKAGDEIFFDKKRPDIKYVAPVSGEIAAINRGAKRSIAEVVILADDTVEYKQFDTPSLDADRTVLVDFLLASGAWTLIRQRPFNTTPDPAVIPRDIFISTFDTSPLAPNLNKVIEGKEAAFQKGLDVLAALTSGKVYLGLDGRGKRVPAKAYLEATGVEKHYFNGKHPAGNVGIQIHHTKPLNSGEVVWTLGVQEVASIGTLFLEGKMDLSRVVALTGAEFKKPKYVRTYLGANIDELVKDNLNTDHVRLVSGNVLSGKQKQRTAFLNYFDNQLTVLEEGDHYELFGWLLPLSPRPSISNTFPNFLFPEQKFKANTNTHGEKRAFVITSDYEQVMPADIQVQALMKSIMVNDFERMEGLGILELVEEDIALCEFVCTSKMPLQKILRDGLDTVMAQG